MTHVIQNPCEKLQLMFVLKLVDVDDVIVFNFTNSSLERRVRGLLQIGKIFNPGMIFLLKF